MEARMDPKDLKELERLASESGIPEVLDAVAAVLKTYADKRPDDQAGDWYALVLQVQEAAGRAREYEQHFDSRRTFYP